MGKLPPTGITYYSDATTNTADSSVGADNGAFPRQDARYNRPFDYTKIANDGTSLPSTVTLGARPKDWACTKDNITGLVWEVKTTSGLRNKDYTYTWYRNGVGTPTGGTCQTTGRCDTEKFAEDVNKTSLCGFSDWRVPGVKELVGITDFGSFAPAVNKDYFPNTIGDYWTNSVGDVNSTWWISGSPNGGHIIPLTGRLPFKVRLVHGTSDFTPVDSPSSNPSFCYASSTQSASNPNSVYKVSPSDDGTVTDTRTSLMWKRCSEGQTWDKSTQGCIGDISAPIYGVNSFSWSDALKIGRNSSFAGYSNWRLPNIKELQSLNEECRAAPSVNTITFPDTPPGNQYWSSTPVISILNSSWGESSGMGEVADFGRNNYLDVRLVRDVTE